ncbi:MAG: alpha,alpha-trehalose-phosphate synthase (UDP-forming) [Desulfurellaceae bacterium]|nr:alpha,alpha-trehalose-phosphate synthase (UDP-forming) [Desulfurellaceae bacterium]
MPTQTSGRLVVVSNRTPDLTTPKTPAETRKPVAGGLVSALRPVLLETGGIWFGWSGKTTRRRESSAPQKRQIGPIQLMTVNLSEEEVHDFYVSFCNRTLWPLFHSFPAQVRVVSREYRTYRRINRYFAAHLAPLLKPDDLVWVHDYHLIPLGMELRRLGWQGRLGFFLHIPFPPVDILTISPHSRPLLEDLEAYDLVGFHTQRYRKNCADALESELGGSFDGRLYQHGKARVQLGVYAIGTDPDSFADWATSPEASLQASKLRQMVRGRRILLGVDRLDYTKGISERLLAFDRLLERHPAWRDQVSMTQISAPSRTRVPEYAAQKREVDRLVGEINGRYSEDDWIPVRHLYRSYTQEELAAFYREADVCLVTPLRDGMNLVAKEYIASQTDNPGVLLLSQFCGTAEDLVEAVIVNPYDIDGTASALNRALNMNLTERRERWQALNKRVHERTAQTWRDRFLADLEKSDQAARPSSKPKTRSTKSKPTGKTSA